ncbi:expressed conserved protein [Echinococcus multilocularis]|uniref:Expressed conserved protein n=1 Tax=Echinococcus multilocularis TaxID=6211 RepID=A0A068XXN2_ECHMU|nr:expressed conserved protein [Echinococcus multilocularis]
MALSRCLDLSKTRDYVHVNEEVIFFTEIGKALHIFAYFPSKGYGYRGPFPSPFLRELASKFNFPNMNLLLTWARERISEEKFTFQDVDSERVNFIIGSAPPVQLIFQLSRSQSEGNLILSIAKALLCKQAHVEELEKSNAELLNHMSVQDSFPSPSHKRKTSGMSFTNPHLRKRKPATGLTFISDTGVDET